MPLSLAFAVCSSKSTFCSPRLPWPRARLASALDVDVNYVHYAALGVSLRPPCARRQPAAHSSPDARVCTRRVRAAACVLAPRHALCSNVRSPSARQPQPSASRTRSIPAQSAGAPRNSDEPMHRPPRDVRRILRSPRSAPRWEPRVASPRGASPSPRSPRAPPPASPAVLQALLRRRVPGGQVQRLSLLLYATRAASPEIHQTPTACHWAALEPRGGASVP